MTFQVMIPSTRGTKLTGKIAGGLCQPVNESDDGSSGENSEGESDMSNTDESSGKEDNEEDDDISDTNTTSWDEPGCDSSNTKDEEPESERSPSENRSSPAEQSSSAPASELDCRSDETCIKPEVGDTDSQVTKMDAYVLSLQSELQSSKRSLEVASQTLDRKTNDLKKWMNRQKASKKVILEQEAVYQNLYAQWRTALAAKKSAEEKKKELYEEATQIRLNIDDSSKERNKAEDQTKALRRRILCLEKDLKNSSKELAILKVTKDPGLQSLARSLHGLKNVSSKIKSELLKNESNEADTPSKDLEDDNDKTDQESEPEWMDVDDEEATIYQIAALGDHLEKTQNPIKAELEPTKVMKSEFTTPTPSETVGDDQTRSSTATSSCKSNDSSAESGDSKSSRSPAGEEMLSNLHQDFSAAEVIRVCARMQKDKAYINACMAHLRNAVDQNGDVDSKVPREGGTTRKRKEMMDGSYGGGERKRLSPAVSEDEQARMERHRIMNKPVRRRFGVENSSDADSDS